MSFVVYLLSKRILSSLVLNYTTVLELNVSASIKAIPQWDISQRVNELNLFALGLFRFRLWLGIFSG